MQELAVCRLLILKDRMGCASSNILKQERPTAWLLGDAARLHLQHGPIDLIIDAAGSSAEIKRAYRQAAVAFESVLDTLAAQLPALRQESRINENFLLKGDVARRMQQAVQPYSEFHVTPMAAVAGAVADHILSYLIHNRALDRAQVNNGGDIALYLSPASELKIGICKSQKSTDHSDTFLIKPEDGIGGVATSGWQGRSFSLGIADAVTVLASTAADADVAATLIANAVNLPVAQEVTRTPAASIQPDSDLGNRLVTINVAPLSDINKKQALNAGVQCAKKLMNQGNIHSCYLHLQGQTKIVESSCYQSTFCVSQRYAHC